MKLKKIFAFTLAEVLITLSILGVVAAITVPSLIKRNEEKSTVTKVLKFYSALQQAFDVAVAEDGPPSRWGIDDGTEFAMKIYNKMNYTKICTDNSNDCVADKYITMLNGEEDWLKFSGMLPAFRMKDGSGASNWVLSTTCTANESHHGEENRNTCFRVNYDVNGPAEPNIQGKDIFLFYVTNEGVNPPSGDSCTKEDSGYHCSEYILKNKNMNYLH